MKQKLNPHRAKPMFAIASPAIHSTALSASPAVLAAPVVDAVSTRQTAIAVAAPLAGSQLADDTQAHVTIVPASSAEQGSATPAPAATPAATAAVTPGNGPSTPFLAQLIGQSAGEQEDSQIGFMTSFSHFLPAPQYNQLIGYSIVRYRPSDAGLPSSYYSANVPAESEDDSTTPQAAVAGEYNAYSATQTRNQSNLSGPEPQLSTAG